MRPIVSFSQLPTFSLTIIPMHTFTVEKLTSMAAYRNNTFTFAAADPGFPGSLRVGRGIVASEPVTADGGRVWTVDEILIPDSKYGSARTAASPPKAGSEST